MANRAVIKDPLNSAPSITITPNLQQRLRIFRLGPVQEAAAGNVADASQLLFRTFDGVLIMDSLRYTRR